MVLHMRLVGIVLAAAQIGIALIQEPDLRLTAAIGAAILIALVLPLIWRFLRRRLQYHTLRVAAQAEDKLAHVVDQLVNP